MAKSSIKLTNATRLLHLRHVYPQLGRITTLEGCNHFTQDFSHFSKTHLTPYYNNNEEEMLYTYEATSWFLGKFCMDNHFVELVYDRFSPIWGIFATTRASFKILIFQYSSPSCSTLVQHHGMHNSGQNI